MKKTWLAIISVVFILGVIGLTGCSGELGTVQVTTGQQQGIWVTAEGKVPVTPDIAVISMGVEAQAATVAEAQAQAAAAMDSILAALKNAGVEDKDIQTQYFSIYPVTRWYSDEEKEEVTGYRVSNTVSVKIRDISKAGDIIDAVAVAGGDNTRINNIQFDVEDKTEYYAEAREIAVKYAKTKAEQIAEAAGISLGDIIYITETTYTPGPIYRNYDMAVSEASAQGVGTSISTGELELSTSVQVNFAIK